MIAFYLLASIFMLILWIVIIIKFFKIASNVKEMTGMARDDYQSKRMYASEQIALQNSLKDFEMPNHKIIEDQSDYFRVKLGEDVYYDSYKKFGLWPCKDNNGKMFYFKDNADALKALCYFHTQNK